MSEEQTRRSLIDSVDTLAENLGKNFSNITKGPGTRLDGEFYPEVANEQIKKSGVCISFVGTDREDPPPMQQVYELGLMVWYDKPIIVVAMPGAEVNEAMVTLATKIIYLEPGDEDRAAEIVTNEVTRLYEEGYFENAPE